VRLFSAFAAYDISELPDVLPLSESNPTIKL
jgi:hypothetical protein